jgi:hypothetical protein
MPVDVPYNGKLVIWAHKFQDAGTDIQMPEDQLSFGDFSIPEVITSLGYAFATNSYSKTGLTVQDGLQTFRIWCIFIKRSMVKRLFGRLRSILKCSTIDRGFKSNWTISHRQLSNVGTTNNA